MTALPEPHLAGSSPCALLEQYIDSANALSHALDVLRKNGPSARDYFMHRPPNSFAAALREHADRIHKLDEVLTEIRTIGEHVGGWS